MAHKITRPILLAAVLGSGLALGTIGSATAVYADPYPPTPTTLETQMQEQDQDEDQRQAEAQNQKNSSTVGADVKQRHHGHHHEKHHVEEVEVEQLPVTGAPVEALAATGAGLLLAGTFGAAIAIRRRGTAGAR